MRWFRRSYRIPVEVVDIQPGDKLVIHTTEPLTSDAAQRLQEAWDAWKAASSSQRQTIVACGIDRFSVLRFGVCSDGTRRHDFRGGLICAGCGCSGLVPLNAPATAEPAVLEHDGPGQATTNRKEA